VDNAILSEALARLRALHGGAIARLRVERAVVGIVFSGVRLSDGSGGIAGTPRKDGCHSRKEREDPPPGTLCGTPVLSLLEPFPEEPFRRCLAVAAMNALSAPWLAGGGYRAVFDRDALDLSDIRPGMSVTLVGAFHSYIDRLKSAGLARLRVLELRESALREADLPYYVPAERAAEVIPESDLLIVTGLTVANGTLEGLLSMLRSGASAIVVGPSGSIIPDALFRRNVRMASGCVLTAPDDALDLLSQGASARHLYGRCARKVNLSPL